MIFHQNLSESVSNPWVKNTWCKKILCKDELRGEISADNQEYLHKRWEAACKKPEEADVITFLCCMQKILLSTQCWMMSSAAVIFFHCISVSGDLSTDPLKSNSKLLLCSPLRINFISPAQFWTVITSIICQREEHFLEEIINSFAEILWTQSTIPWKEARSSMIPAGWEIGLELPTQMNQEKQPKQQFCPELL